MAFYRALKVRKNQNGTVELVDALDRVIASAPTTNAPDAPMGRQEQYVLNAYNAVAYMACRHLYGGSIPTDKTGTVYGGKR